MTKNQNVIVLGSSRLRGHTWEIAEALAAIIDADIIVLKVKKIAYYDYDNNYEPDDFLPIIEKMLQYDQIIFATPVYWYAMSAQLKTFIDRFSDLVRVKKEMGRSLKGKKIFAISCGSDNAVVEGFEIPFRNTADYLEMEYGGYLHAWKMDGDISGEVRKRIGEFAEAVVCR